MKNTMKSTRRMRKLPFSYSNPRNDPTTNIEPNTASDLFCHALHSMYACISNKPTPELFILIFAASFLLVDRFFTTILNILGKLSLQNWRHCNIHKPLPHTRQLTPAMTQVMTPARKRSVPSCIFTCSDLGKRANRLGFQPKSFTRRRLSRYNSHIGPAPWAVPSYLRAQPPSTCISKPWLHNHVNCHSSTASGLQSHDDQQRSIGIRTRRNARPGDNIWPAPRVGEMYLSPSDILLKGHQSHQSNQSNQPFQSKPTQSQSERHPRTQQINSTNHATMPDYSTSDDSTPATPAATLVNVRPHAVMPRPGQLGSMLFDGNNITDFLEDWNIECEDYGLTDAQKCARFPNYCTPAIKDLFIVLDMVLMTGLPFKQISKKHTGNMTNRKIPMKLSSNLSKKHLPWT